MVKLSCYLVLIFGTLSAYFTNTRGECKVNQDSEKLYKELNCSPVKDSQGCVTSYDCSSIFSIKNDKCYYQGKEINLGERIDREEIQSTCTPTCTCLNSGGKATLDCAHYDCPEFFQPPLKPNCVRTYSHDSCCATGTACKDSQTKTLAKCEYNGKVYLEGQKFEAEGKRCKNCICQPGFNGTLESPWCEDVQCDPQLFHLRKVQESCAPVFYGDDSCCPINFHCPSEPSSTETQESTESNVTPVVQKTSDGAKCKFGNQIVEIGQKVSTTEHCTECSCELPPLITCVVNAECYQDRSK